MQARLSEQQTAQSLDACRKEGMASQPALSAVDYYVTPLAISLGASAGQIGLLVAIPAVMGSLAYLCSVRAVRYLGSRLRLLLDAMGAQIILLLLVGLLSVVRLPYNLALLLLMVVGIRLLNGLMGPAWGSLVSEYLPAERRPPFFAARTQAVHLAGIAGLAFWGSLLWLLHRLQLPEFLVLFVCAAACRYGASRYMGRMADLPLPPESNPGSFWQFLCDLRRNRVGRFVLYVVLLTLAISVSGPFTSVRMLRELQFSYLGYTAVQVAAVLATVFTVPLWGRYASRAGNARVLKVTGLCVPLIPLLWMFGRHSLDLMLVEAAGGFVWCGFELCLGTYLYEAVPPASRMRVLAYFNVLRGAAAFAGTLLGGILAEHLPPLGGSRLVSVFLVSAMLRIAVNGLFVQGVEDTRQLSTARTSLVLLARRMGHSFFVPLAARRFRLAWRGARRVVLRSGWV